MLDKIKELNVELVKVDMTSNDAVYKNELLRTEMKNLPVNLIYPADYPNRPAIMLPEFISPAIALEALEKIAPDAKGRPKETDLSNTLSQQ